MKVAITGASGFIGRHVLRELIKYQIEVVAVTRNKTNLIDFKNAVRIVQMDISHHVPDCFNLLGCPDILIHLAWDGLPNYKSLHHFEVELPKQYKFLKTMFEGGLPSLVVTGTCFEYGMQCGCLTEEMPTKPVNPYGFAKDALRRQLEFLKLIKPFNLTWVRLFYMYGEGQANTSLYSKLKEAVSRKEKNFNMSGGEQLRDYLPVHEVAHYIASLSLLQQNLGIVNICSGKPISVRNLVEQWLCQNNWNIELNLGYYPYPDYEPMAFWGDTKKLIKIMNNTNKLALSHGIKIK